jgi:hypothetical protein
VQTKVQPILFGALIVVLASAVFALKLVRYSPSKCAVCRRIRFLYKTTDNGLVCAQCALAAHTDNKV